MESDANRREFTRISFQIDVELTAEPFPSIDCELRDVSLNGLYLVCADPLPLGTDCRVALLLGGPEHPSRIEVHATVTRVEAAGMGLEITGILGVESFEHLRNLVLYNAPQREQVEQEMQSHRGIRRRE
jgi:hypothetical protein